MINRLRILQGVNHPWWPVVARELFYFFFFTWVILNLMEIIFSKIVLVYFNLNYLFLVAVIFGLASLVQPRAEKNNP
ncbi:MAG: hypothetical protein WC441_00300 [Patescibacteria group bacterium]